MDKTEVDRRFMARLRTQLTDEEIETLAAVSDEEIPSGFRYFERLKPHVAVLSREIKALLGRGRLKLTSSNA